jgi:methylated-DNA-protein-cysteine methyltransferase-like protein
LDLSPPSESHLKILDVIRRIPKGRVATYGQVAELAGLPGRARLVGHILRNNPMAANVPWHRVINAAGKISVRSGEGPQMQRRRLRAEGVTFTAPGKVNLDRHLWRR